MKDTRWLTAWLAALALSALGLLARIWLEVTYPPLELFGWLTRLFGVPEVFQLVHSIFGFGQGGKVFAFLNVALLWLGALTLLGRLRSEVAALLLAAVLLTFTPWPVALAYTAAHLALRHAVRGLLRPVRGADATRRTTLAGLWGGSLLLAAGGLASLARTVSPARATVGPNGEMPPGITPVKDFYYVSKNLEPFDPKVDGAKWRLRVTGMVETPLSLSLADLQQFEQRTVELTLACISNPVGGPLMGNALWTGFSVADLLRRAGVRRGAQFIVWRAEDGYEESLPLGDAFEEDVLLVHAMNGAPLTQKHGFPLRVLIPGRYGMKQPRWISEIRLTERDEPGYWVKRGWSSTARVEITSRIDAPEEINPIVKADSENLLRGVAFAGTKPITKVEVSTDGGGTWQAALLGAPRSRHAWTEWELPWTPRVGSYELMVRAYSGGELQKRAEKDALPEGATGWHHFIVTAS